MTRNTPGSAALSRSRSSKVGIDAELVAGRAWRQSKTFPALSPGGNFLLVAPGRIAYRLAVNSLDSIWVWTCDLCAARITDWERGQIETKVRLHRCQGEGSLRWRLAGGHRFRHK